MSAFEVQASTQSLGSGASKEAFAIEQVPIDKHDSHNFTIPDIEELVKFCIVKYKRLINWRNQFTPEFLTFKQKMDSDPMFRFFIENGMTHHELLKTKYKDFMSRINPNAFVFYKNLLNQHREQYECKNEVMEFIHLGESFAPKLLQIRIDETDRDGTITNYGRPFSPEEIEEKIKELNIPYSIVSFLIERCDSGLIEYVKAHRDEENSIGIKVVNFINAFVNVHKKLNCDIKPENLCLKIGDAGKIESVRLLDVDPDFNISGKTSEFMRNSKVFMKLLFFGYFKRRFDYKFENWRVSQEEVVEMIRFFYTDKYMIYAKNPINSLYHYLIHDHPNKFLNRSEPIPYAFFQHNSLFNYFKTPDEMANFFMKVISEIEEVALPPVKVDGKSKALEGGKKRRKSKRRNSKKSKRNHTSKCDRK